MKFDLHMHSHWSSDGQFTEQELAGIAKDKGMDVIALSDHDSVEGVANITRLAEQAGIQVIPALECSTKFHEYPVHVLGYDIRLDDPYITSLKEKVKSMNDSTFSVRVQKMRDKYGIDIDEDWILEQAAGKSPWFTLINWMLTLPEIQAHPDFQDYLPGGSRSNPAPVNFYWDNCMPGSDLHVPERFPDFFETIRHIHEAGGLAVIAHPFTTFYQHPERLQEAMDAGIDGLEAYSNYHTPEMNAWYSQYAKDNGLLMTCGSDFHGEKKPAIVMGEYGLTEDGQPILEAFLQARKDNPYAKTGS